MSFVSVCKGGPCNKDGPGALVDEGGPCALVDEGGPCALVDEEDPLTLVNEGVLDDKGCPLALVDKGCPFAGAMFLGAVMVGSGWSSSLLMSTTRIRDQIKHKVPAAGHVIWFGYTHDEWKSNFSDSFQKTRFEPFHLRS